MTPLRLLITALGTMRTAWLRTLLAVLGVVIGVAAVVAMLALGRGAQAQVIERMSAMGTDLLSVRAAHISRFGVSGEDAVPLKPDDADAILRQVPGVLAVAPACGGMVQARNGNRNMRALVTASAPTYFSVRNYPLEKGRIFTDWEDAAAARVAVLGAVAAERLFGTTDPIGRSVALKGVVHQVIGVMKAKGDQGYWNPDEQIVVPLRTGMDRVLGLQALTSVEITAGGDGIPHIATQEAIDDLLRLRQRTPVDRESGFTIRNQADIVDAAAGMTRTLTILLGCVAGISLLVGGIGIMNIMLVSVTERTREIGVRKAIGARDRDILRQFTLEAALVSFSGGVLGLLLGLGTAWAVRTFTTYGAVPATGDAVLALGTSIATGIFFGWYPARRAARLDPIEALRHD